MMHTFKFAEMSGYPDYLKRAVEELKKFRDCIITPAETWFSNAKSNGNTKRKRIS